MRKIFAALFLFVLFTAGCQSQESALDRAFIVRQNLQQNGCEFEAEITADYGDKFQTFNLKCAANKEGDLHFSVFKPDTIAGITGIIEDNTGKLTFDDTVLAFELLTDDQISPVSAPWILIRTLRGGYIHAAADTDTGMKLVIHDSYEEDSLQLNIWIDENETPTDAEILWKGRRILTIKVKDFIYV